MSKIMVRRTPNSVQFVARHSADRRGLLKSPEGFVAQEFKIVEHDDFTAIEYYLTLNQPSIERKEQVRHIMEVVRSYVKGTFVMVQKL
ncbi:MAG: hypothetical protein ACLQF0_05510 [Dissulfurispiraceae bacterium]